MTRSRIVLHLFVMLVAVSCGGRSKGLYPLGEGEKWTYQATTKSVLGANQNATITITNMPKRELAEKSVTPQKTEANGQTVFSFVGEDSDGVFLLANQTPNSAEPEIVTPPPYLLHKPYEKGTKWEVKSSGQMSTTGEPLTLEATIEGINETVTVPAGTYEGCLKVISRGEQVKKLGSVMGQAKISVEQTSWFCPGVGLVRSINKTNSNNLMAMENAGEFSLQLESHASQ